MAWGASPSEQTTAQLPMSSRDTHRARVRWVGPRPLLPCGAATLGWSRGYAFADTDPGRVLEGNAIARYLAARDPDVVAAGARLNGSFAAFVASGEATHIVTDRYA